jgi:hypothetical protein
MGAVIQLAQRVVTDDQVKRAYAVVRGLKLAEMADSRLTEDSAHQAAKTEAQEKFERLYDEWARRC